MVNIRKWVGDKLGLGITKSQLLTEQATISEFGFERSPYGGHPAVGLTPQGLSIILQQSSTGDPRRFLELCEDMEERNEHYLSVLSTRKLQISGLEITVEPASNSTDDEEAANLVREVIARPAFQVEIIDILDALGKSFSCTEILWDTSEGQWLPKKLSWRDPRWFKFQKKDGDTLLLRDQSGDQLLKPFSWIVHRAKIKSGLTIRGGLARAAAWNFMFKTFTSKDWAVFVEAYGQPIRLGKYGPNASDEDKKVLMHAVASIGSDFSAIMPESTNIEFAQAKLTGSHDLYEKRELYLDRQMSKLVLGQVGTTDAVAGGFAGNKVHDEVRQDIEKADAVQLAIVLNRDVGHPVVDLNFGPKKKYPIIKVGRPDEEDVEALVKNVNILVPLGARISMQGMMRKIGAPEVQKGETPLMARGKPEVDPDIDDKLPSGKSETAALQTSSHTDAIADSIATHILNDDWEPLVAPIIDGLEEKIAVAKSAAEVREILRQQAQTMDVDAFAEALTQMAFGARISGEVDEGLD